MVIPDTMAADADHSPEALSSPEGRDPASVTLEQRVGWIDTDAAGIAHWTTVFRFIEAAEAHLHETLGIRARTFGRTPRVHVEADFRLQLPFYASVTVELKVVAVGDSSLRYGFTVISAEGTVVVGQLVVVHIDADRGQAMSWPADIRALLLEGGHVGLTVGG